MTNGNGNSIINKLTPTIKVAAISVTITIFLLTMIFAAERKANDAYGLAERANVRIDAQEKRFTEICSELRYIKTRLDRILDRLPKSGDK